MLKKITESDINGLGVVGLADTPGLSATDMQEKFEEISKSAIIPKFNQLIDDLEALNIYHKVDSVEGKGLSTNDYTNEDKEALYSTKGKIDETVKIFGKASIDFGRKPDTDKGDKSTALGSDNTASGNYSDALGQNNISSGLASHSEGANNISSGRYSHAEGRENEAIEDYSHAEGYKTKATGLSSHAEGDRTTAGIGSHAEGHETTAIDYGHAEGELTTASGFVSHSEGSETQATGRYSHSEGKLTVASGQHSHAEGNTTKAIANNSHAEGIFTKVDLSGENGHAEGYGSIVTGESSHAEGINTKAEGNHSHAEGSNTTAKGSGSHAEGAGTVSEGENSHTEGSYTTASGNSSHSEGASSQASGSYSHAEGAGTVAAGDYSHAEGSGTRAKGSNAHAEGGATIATGGYQHVQGKFNEEDADGIYAHIVGGGTSDTDRKNIHTIDWQGNAEFAGNVTDGYGNSMSLLKTESGHSLELNIDENYIMTISLLNKSGETISSKAIDFPVESMVVNASYSSGKLTLVLQNGNMVDVDVSAIVKGLVNESRTIAGIDLKDDITADELIAALGIDTIKEDVAQLNGDLIKSVNKYSVTDSLNSVINTKYNDVAFNITQYANLDGYVWLSTTLNYFENPVNATIEFDVECDDKITRIDIINTLTSESITVKNITGIEHIKYDVSGMNSPTIEIKIRVYCGVLPFDIHFMNLCSDKEIQNNPTFTIIEGTGTREIIDKEFSKFVDYNDFYDSNEIIPTDYVTGKFTNKDKTYSTDEEFRCCEFNIPKGLEKIGLYRVWIGGNISIWLKKDNAIIDVITKTSMKEYYEEIDVNNYDSIVFSTKTTTETKVIYLDYKQSKYVSKEDLEPSTLKLSIPDTNVGFTNTYGTISTDQSYRYTDWINVKGGEKIKISHALMTSSACVQMKTVFAGKYYSIDGASSDNKTFEFVIPNDVMYIRYSVAKRFVSTTEIKYLTDYKHFTESFIPSLYYNAVPSRNDKPVITFVDDDGRNEYLTVLKPVFL